MPLLLWRGGTGVDLWFRLRGSKGSQEGAHSLVDETADEMDVLATVRTHFLVIRTGAGPVVGAEAAAGTGHRTVGPSAPCRLSTLLVHL